jgi:hypothetical protein
MALTPKDYEAPRAIPNDPQFGENNELVITYNHDQKFKYKCQNQEIEELGCGNSRISTCSYKSNDMWDLSLHKKIYHQEKSDDENISIAKRILEI